MREGAGGPPDDHTIRPLGPAVAPRAGGPRAPRASAEAFAQAEGDLALQIGAGKVNPLGGWRDVHVAGFGRRERGAPTTAAARDGRDRPAPTVRSLAVAAAEAAPDSGARRAAGARRLELTDPQRVSVLGDGAEGVRDLSAAHSPGALELLDIWHGAQRLSDGADAARGQGHAAAKEQAKAAAQRGKQRLLGDGEGGVRGGAES